MPPSPPPRPTVLNDAAMVFLRMAGLAAVLTAMYIVFARERAGFILLAALAFAALAAGVAVVLSGLPEVSVMEQAPEGSPVTRPVRRGFALPGPSALPIAGAAAVTLLAASTLWGPAVGIFGAVIGLITAFTASAVVSGEQRGRHVNLMPIGVPVMALFAIGTFMFLMSRILLAVDANVSTAVALVLAAAILGGAFFVANHPAIPSRVLMRGLGAIGILFLGGGLVAASVGQRPEERKAGPPPVKLLAQNIQFSLAAFKLDADTPATINFKNLDKVAHNVDITRDEAGSDSVFRQDPIPGPTSLQYRFTAPAAGHYFFHCDVHPNMKGTIQVLPSKEAATATIAEKAKTATSKPEPAPPAPKPQAAPPPPPPPAAGATSATEKAQGIAFQQKELSLKAGSDVVVHFDNADSGIPHNMAFTKDSGGSDVIFRGDIVTGPTTTDYKFTTPPPGSYFFHCDVHPNMQGKLTIT